MLRKLPVKMVVWRTFMGAREREKRHIPVVYNFKLHYWRVEYGHRYGEELKWREMGRG